MEPPTTEATSPEDPSESVGKPPTVFDRWPSRVIGAATSILLLLVAFGVPITGSQQAAILAVMTALAPFGVAWVSSHFTYSPATVKKMKDEHASEIATKDHEIGQLKRSIHPDAPIGDEGLELVVPATLEPTPPTSALRPTAVAPPPKYPPVDVKRGEK